jgi:CRP-like cAMP-binding protein
MERGPLEIDPETMRQLGYRTVDLLVDRLAGLREQPVLRRGAPAEPPAQPTYDRDPPVTRSWPNRWLADGLERVAGRAGERAVAEGEPVVERWDATREFYTVLEGTAVVRSGERRLDDIGPGDYFGELAAEITRTARDRLPGL